MTRRGKVSYYFKGLMLLFLILDLMVKPVSNWAQLVFHILKFDPIDSYWFEIQFHDGTSTNVNDFNNLYRLIHSFWLVRRNYSLLV
jgi:hypothetical protein